MPSAPPRGATAPAPSSLPSSAPTCPRHRHVIINNMITTIVILIQLLSLSSIIIVQPDYYSPPPVHLPKHVTLVGMQVYSFGLGRDSFTAHFIWMTFGQIFFSVLVWIRKLSLFATTNMISVQLIHAQSLITALCLAAEHYFRVDYPYIRQCYVPVLEQRADWRRSSFVGL